jgi:hypothetical protein
MTVTGKGPRARIAAALVALVASVLVPAAAQAAEPIVNTEPPSVSGRTAYAERLMAHVGSWTPDGLTYTYQWHRDGADIEGATGRARRLVLADLGHRMSVTVTATDAEGTSQSATSAETATVEQARIANRRLPRVTGARRYTRLLTASAGRWSVDPATVRYRWLRGGDPIAGANKRRYRLQPADVGERVTVAVTVRRDGYRAATARAPRGGRVQHRVPVRRTVTYRVETRGAISASLATFKRQVAETYADPRGWRSAGIAFKRVAKGGTFSVVLAQASWVPRFSPVCSAQWSCRVGRFVVINQNRWQHASPAWNAADLALRDYRHMVVNHETGHWLGHGHKNCSGPGRKAPVMQQQSKGLQGCQFNPWPLPSELWTRR